MIYWPRDYAIQVGLHLPITTAICGAALLHWSLPIPASVLLWFYHEMTQNMAKEKAQVQCWRNHSSDWPKYIVKADPTHWQLFKTWGHRRWFDLTGHLAGGILVAMLARFV